jgi:hypothetical protein
MSAIGMEMPPQPTKDIAGEKKSDYFDRLPPDVKRLITSEIFRKKISSSSDVVEVARTIRRLNITNRFFHEYFKDPKNLLAIIEMMPTARDGNFLITLLRKTNIPAAKDPLIDAWKNKNMDKVWGKIYFVPRVINLD